MEHDSDYSEFVKKLIDAVRERHCIYDKKHSSYFNKIERERAWCEIADVLGQSVDDCQKRWKLLREKLAKELKKRDRALACGERFHSDWTCYDKIVFIEDHIAPRKKLEKYPFFLAPIDFQEKFMHTSCDVSDHSSTAKKNIHENHEQQQQQHEQEYNNLSSYHHNAKRQCQRNLSQSPILEVDLSNKNNSNYKETSFSGDSKIKTEPNEMVDIDDISTEPDMYELEMMEEKIQPRNNSYPINMSNEVSNEPQRKKRLQLKRFDVEQATGLQPNTYHHHHGMEHINAQMNTKPLASKKSTSDSDDCDKLFGKMVTAMLKDIPVEEHKDDVKLHIMQMLIRAKRGHIGSYN